MKSGSIPALILVMLMLTLCSAYPATVCSVENTPLGQETVENGPQPLLRRFAVIIGANDGGAGRNKLKYAVSDAKAFLKILEDLGGVEPEYSRLLIDPKKESLFWEFSRLASRVAAARAGNLRAEAIIYYSGHSDERHILLGKEKISYKEFSDAINAIDADVRITILDSCASGAFIRIKGGKKKPPFLMDAAYDMKGYAIMTSSSSDEASQESDRLAGSFFTHFLIAGLRGAADMTGDGRVTLSEAYQFAFNETLSRTTGAMNGPQHPNYNIQMKGSGDVVMTDIRRGAARLSLPAAIEGRIFIHQANNTLAVELSKTKGRTLELGLDEGVYRLIILLGDQVRETRLTLPPGQTTALKPEQLKHTELIDTVARGDLNFRKNTLAGLAKNKVTFFFDLVNKYTTLKEKSILMMGGKFGITYGRFLSLGLQGSANIYDVNLAHPVYWGFTIDVMVPVVQFLNLRVGVLIGSGEAELLQKQFTVFEPEVALMVNISRNFSLSGGAAWRMTDQKMSGLGSFSWCFNIRIGR